MQVGHESPNIIRFTYRQEKGDKGYGSCLWANFDFDLDEYVLSIQSDCGYYGYGWNVTPSEPFLHLMARINEDYLLNKLCQESVVDWQATKEALIEAIDDLNPDDDDREDAIRHLEAIQEDYDVAGDIGACEVLIENWNEDNFHLDDIYEYVRTDYTGNQKKIAEIFRDHIQPAIQEFIKGKCPYFGGFDYQGTIFCNGEPNTLDCQKDADYWMENFCNDPKACEECNDYKQHKAKAEAKS